MTDRTVKHRSSEAALRHVALGVIVLTWTITPARSRPLESRGTQFAIVDTSVLDVERGVLDEHLTVVVKSGRIGAVGPAARTKLEEGVETLDGRGKTVLPGLIDSRVHYRDWMGSLFVGFGVTSILDLGNDLRWLFEQRDKIDGGAIRGPRIAATATLVHGEKDDGREIGLTRPSDADALVSALKGKGVDAIRVEGAMPQDLVNAVVQAARKHKLPVISTLETSAADALEVGVNAIAHGPGLAAAFFTIAPAEKVGVNVPDYIRQYRRGQAEAIARLRILLRRGDAYVIDNMVSNSRGVLPRWHEIAADDGALLRENLFAVVPDDIRIKNQDYSLFQALDPRARAEVEGGFLTFGKFLKEVVAQGGRLLAGSGSSTWVLPGISLHRELEMLVALGLSPSQAIRAATATPARFLGRDKERGVVKPNYIADLLVVNGNPLKDIRKTRDIAFVVKDGRVLNGYRNNDARTSGTSRSSR